MFDSAFHQDLVTEGVAVVIFLCRVPPGPPSSSLLAALPQPCGREKAQRGVFAARLSPISQNENNDWLFLWASLEKNPALLGGMGKGFLLMDQIPTRNLQGCTFTVIHFTGAARALKTQKRDVDVGPERVVWPLTWLLKD